MFIWNLPTEAFTQGLKEGPRWRWERYKHISIGYAKTYLNVSTATCRALKMTLADRGERVVLLSSCCSRLRSKPLKSVGGL